MNGDYWPQFWQRQGETSQGQHPQARVLRTLGQQPIADRSWQATVDSIRDRLDLSSHHRMLDLCGGNGLIANALIDDCGSVTIVDVSDKLLPTEPRDANGKLFAKQADMRAIAFPPRSFERILLYAALQYLTQQESARMLARIFEWLSDDSLVLIGDIPDAARRWEFFNTEQRRSEYFTDLAAGHPIVGTWFDRRWLEYLASDCGYRDVQICEQPADHIYAWFRFDMVCRK